MSPVPAPSVAVRTVATVATVVAGLVAVTSLAACGDGNGGTGSGPAPRPTTETTTGAAVTTAGDPVIDPGDGGDYVADLDPADVADVIDNPYHPLIVGSTWRYEGESDGEIEVVEVVVTGEREEVMGISAVVVRDTVTVDGELVEDTLDWFVQDKAGNVWYLGEDVKDYENGKVVSTAGSWRAGTDGAQPGIVMPADPTIGDVYRQEFLRGEAEDMMEIIAVDATVTVPAGRYTDVVRTRDWTPLEPETIEEKAYAPGVGRIRGEKVAGGVGFVELVEFSPGS